MVYGKFFRKPFSKTRVRLPLDSFHSHSVSALSLSHCLLSSLHCPEPSSHPQPPLAIPSRPQHPGLISAPFLSFSACFLSRPARAQPTRAKPSHPIVHCLTDRPSHRSHCRTARALHRSASPKVTPTVAQLDLI
uniref:Uncharacterized protein n=1 Tax=Fagus sylvatica TaxID=28930 RepID=A0A2N9HZH2_FAGSY